MTGLAHMLLGAVLVAIGVVAVGIADRIRGIRFAREATTRERQSRLAPATLAATRVRRSHQVESAPAANASNRARARSLLGDVSRSDLVGIDDVIAALVAAGYKKPIATEAARGCCEAERVTVEQWTRAALRRCAKGAAS